MMAKNLILTFIFIILFLPLPAQESKQASIPLYEDPGTYSRNITTSSEMAQKYFDQGLQLAYGFARQEAVESFREAQKYDSECAMCYWGEALALGKYINTALVDPVMRSKRAKEAFHANQKAWQTDQKASYNKAVATYPGHNLHMLIFAARLDGQSAVALQASKDLAQLNPSRGFYRYLARVRFGRWKEMLDFNEKPQDLFQGVFWHFGQGMAHLRKENKTNAQNHLDNLTNNI